ncbi:NADH dehydrogenase ubiquinone 1 beta subcomplex subunit 10 [Hondaea fermentalgiana]|uniref:NADH dehydrogenase ubiquinone 1 beta subcomplex subunit 10 n=1 Tax=Hondaea fermentalgiana TaxID=2315210 RepID=A0A2R5GL01_9STRA|nr:NADH dehydrogenase ubiquinone 1 beta subcomplex subunit 10 [Hondaea fermentalgiana]|eukprot:GBG31315.1 NADH dehydrogenase ubiquinone 1 beta subcomplex subunit 10 [Hondaea fermentalgiana]
MAEAFKPRTETKYTPVPDFEEGEDGLLRRFKEPYKNYEARMQRAREQLIAKEYVNVLRNRVNECYYEAGVNHYEDCKEVVEAYMNAWRAKDHGALYTKKAEE